MSAKEERHRRWLDQYGQEVDDLRCAGGLEWEDVEVILKDAPKAHYEEILHQFVRTIPPKQRHLL